MRPPEPHPCMHGTHYLIMHVGKLGGYAKPLFPPIFPTTMYISSYHQPPAFPSQPLFVPQLTFAWLPMVLRYCTYPNQYQPSQQPSLRPWRFGVSIWSRNFQNSWIRTTGWRMIQSRYLPTYLNWWVGRHKVMDQCMAMPRGFRLPFEVHVRILRF